MLTNLRTAALAVLPARAVHAYRVIRHLHLQPYEPELRYVPHFLSKDHIAVDVGANVGLFATLLAKGSRKVIAFEPHPACAAHLRRIRKPNMVIVAKAASNEFGPATLRVPMNDGTEMHALSTIEAKNCFGTEPKASDLADYLVEKTTLDAELQTFMEPDDRIGFIKIDAEGHERAVLEGAEGTLLRDRPVLLIELEYRHSADVSATFSFLSSRNYHALALRNGQSLEPINHAELQGLQKQEQLPQKLANSNFSGYVNNVFFVPDNVLGF